MGRPSRRCRSRCLVSPQPARSPPPSGCGRSFRCRGRGLSSLRGGHRLDGLLGELHDTLLQLRPRPEQAGSVSAGAVDLEVVGSPGAVWRWSVRSRRRCDRPPPRRPGAGPRSCWRPRRHRRQSSWCPETAARGPAPRRPLPPTAGKRNSHRMLRSGRCDPPPGPARRGNEPPPPRRGRRRETISPKAARGTVATSTFSPRRCWDSPWAR